MFHQGMTADEALEALREMYKGDQFTVRRVSDNENGIIVEWRGPDVTLTLARTDRTGPYKVTEVTHHG